MPKRTKLTNNSDETDLAELISGDNIFYVPYFQRPYKWTRGRLVAFEEDLLSIVDGESDNHFLGALIIHGRRANPSEPTVYDIIDGQQRITTVFLYIFAAISRLCEMGEVDEALALFQKYVSLGRKPKGLSNLKLHSCKEDRHQLNLVVESVAQNPRLREKLGTYLPTPLPRTGSDKGPILKNFGQAKRFFREQAKAAGVERIRALYQAMLENFSVVQIDVWDPTNGPKIFDSLNSRQEPMTIGDLVRNEIFSRVAERDSDEIDEIDETHWQPFYQKFRVDGKNLFDSYFFPFGLIFNPNLSKSEIYSALREKWDKIRDPGRIIDDLAEYQDAFIDLVTGSNLSGHHGPVAQAFGRLARSSAPASTYPFLMRLSRAISLGDVSQGDGVAALELVEGFLVRRAVCGIEPTGLHSVFKRLWADCGGDVAQARVATEIAKHKTVVWPADDLVVASVLERRLYGAAVTPFLLREYDRDLGGDTPLDIPWIEHVLPQTLSAEWLKVFTREQHSQWVDVLANLIPLSSKMNIGLQNASYEKKSQVYLNDSMFKTARELAKGYDTWTADQLRSRSDALAKWICMRWPDLRPSAA